MTLCVYCGNLTRGGLLCDACILGIEMAEDIKRAEAVAVANLACAPPQPDVSDPASS